MTLGTVAKEAAENSAIATIKAAESVIVNTGKIVDSAMIIGSNVGKAAEHGSSAVQFIASIVNNITQVGDSITKRLGDKVKSYQEKQLELDKQKQEILKNTINETTGDEMKAAAEKKKKEIELELKQQEVELQRMIHESKLKLEQMDKEHELALTQQKLEFNRKEVLSNETQNLKNITQEENINKNKLVKFLGYKDSRCRYEGFNTFTPGYNYAYIISFIVHNKQYTKVKYRIGENKNDSYYYVIQNGSEYKLNVEEKMYEIWMNTTTKKEIFGKLVKLNKTSTDTNSLVSTDDNSLSTDDINLEEATSSTDEIGNKKLEGNDPLENVEFQLKTERVWFTNINRKGGKTIKNKKVHQMKTRNRRKKTRMMKTRSKRRKISTRKRHKIRSRR